MNRPKGGTVKILITTIWFVFLMCTIAQATPDDAAARVKTAAGTVSIVRQEKVVPAKVDDKVFTGDSLRTGADGSIGITFKDDTLLSLGPNSEIVVDEFLFSPGQGKLSIVTRMLKGTAAYFAGIIARLSPQSVRFETPVATVGIRGTKFLVKIDNE
jgi:hypothetical protein